MWRRIFALLMATVMASSALVGSVSAEEALIDEAAFGGRQESEAQAPEAEESDGNLMTVVEGGDIISGETATLWPTEVSETVEAPGIVEEVEGEDAPEGAEAIESTELSEAPKTTEVSDEAVLETGGMLLDIEEIGTANYELPAWIFEALNVTVEERLTRSGMASDATSARLRAYMAGVYTDSYGEQLSGDAQTVYQAMKRAYVDSRTPVADASGLSIVLSSPLTFRNALELQDAKESVRRIMQSAYDAFMYDFPEVYWMGVPRYSYSFTSFIYPSSIAKITLNVDMIYAGAGRQIADFDKAVSDMKGQIQAAYGRSLATREDTVRAIHNYLCSILTYGEGYTEMDIERAHSAAGVFLPNPNSAVKTKMVVCEGYAKAFKILCRQFGIPCAILVGDAGGPHMWNCVKMENGSWYLVDVTWDDTVLGPADTTYFLAGNTSTGVSGAPIATERTTYSKFTNSSYSPNFVLPILSATAYHNHSWTTEVIREASCTRGGYSITKCSCGESITQLPAQLSHSFFKGNYVYNNDATCTNDGTMTLYCDYGCRTAANARTAPNISPSKYRVRASGTAKGHRFITYTSDNNAGWYKNGTKTSVCANGCGSKNTVVDPGSARTPTMTVNMSSLVLKTGQSTTAVKVSGLASGDRIMSWKSANTNLVKVSQSGKITAQKKTGTTTVTVTLLSGLKKSIKVKVQAGAVKTTKISGLVKKLTLKRGSSIRLRPVVYPVTSKEKVTYSSSNTKVAAVSSNGLIVAKNSGSAKITVQSGTKKVTVTVTVPKVAATRILNVPKNITLQYKRTKTLKPKLFPAGSIGAIKYASSNKTVVTVSAKGKLTAKKKGRAVITIKAGKAVMKCTVTVK